jgi:hypothetical protein
MAPSAVEALREKMLAFLRAKGRGFKKEHFAAQERSLLTASVFIKNQAAAEALIPLQPLSVTPHDAPKGVL